MIKYQNYCDAENTNVRYLMDRTFNKMQINYLGIFRPIRNQEFNYLGQVHLYSTFKLDPMQEKPSIFLGLSSKYLLYFENQNQKTPTGVCELNFDLKFGILRETPWKNQHTPGRSIGIKFQKQVGHKQYQVLEVYYNNDKAINFWRQYLERSLNQRNFHSLFKAKRRIGKGAFATVYLAERLLDNKMVAVKAFSKEKQFGGEKGKESLINEINLMRMVNHQNVIKLEGVYETQNSIYVILEILEGGQLHQRLKNNQIQGQNETKQIIRNILKGLKALAQKKIIHRDLKPENIMFRKPDSTDLVICDFGLATRSDQEKYLFVRCGTPGFVSPQIINIKDMSTKSDPISDVFSAGLIFHFLLFGRSIFDGKKYNEILAENRACSFNFKKQIYTDVDPLSFDLLKKMLEVDPKLRISSEKALEHPYFSTEKMEEENNQMIDEKFENVSSKTTHKKVYKSTTTKQTLKNEMENEQNKENIPHFMKRSTTMNDHQTPFRKSKKKSFYENQFKYKINHH